MTAHPAARLRVVSAEEGSLPRQTLSSGTLFVAANLLAGALNYLYQVFASRQLPLMEFSALNGWYADLAVFFTVAALLQYGANFFPSPKSNLKISILLTNLALILLLAIWFVLPQGFNGTRALVIVTAASGFGWLSGQAQARMMLANLAWAGIFVGLMKLVAIMIPLSSRLETYSLALLLAYIPATWWMSQALWRSPEPLVKPNPGASAWLAPVILSIAAATFPQMDMVILHHTQAAENFAQFALASLFYKGIYFLAFAYLQWLLPQQMRTQAGLLRWSSWIRAVLLGLFVSAGAAIVGPALAIPFLHWSVAPPAFLIFLSCLNTCLLTWIFVHIQSACTRGKITAAASALGLLGLEAGCQLGLQLSMVTYLLFALGGQTVIASLLMTWDKDGASTKPRPQMPPRPA